MIDYSKWKDIEVSDDEDDTHPNIDKHSLFKWRHEARVQRMNEFQQAKDKLAASITTTKKEIESTKLRLKEGSESDEVKKELAKLEKKMEQLMQEENDLKKKERLMPWNVDTIGTEGWSKTKINKPAPKQDKSNEEEREKIYVEFVKENEKKVKQFGMLSKWDDCKAFLLEQPQLCCEETANYLTLWCLNLEIEEKRSLMEHVSKQVISMQYILELAKQLDCDPRSCIASFFSRIQTADKEYLDAFNDELTSFRKRIKSRAKEKIDAALKEVEEEERQKRLGPGGVDPAEVFEALPDCMKKCFEERDIEALKKVVAEMPEDEAKYHMKRCVDSGLWIPDAGKPDEGDPQ
ncbi:cell division cycle protein 37 isoform X2 [Brevipalpus obovatus]|uniref:cell division cycle protein 37 isoform X2 n=1 Tax=Brevipalpus obovatus TaxID=246614 RepID=UPI003D9F7BD3